MKLIVDLSELGCETVDDLAEALSEYIEREVSVDQLFSDGMKGALMHFIGAFFMSGDQGRLVKIDQLDEATIVAKVLDEMEARA